MSTWFTRPPIDVPDNAQRRETVLYGPKGQPLVIREPRSIGFRRPKDDKQTEAVQGGGKDPT